MEYVDICKQYFLAFQEKNIKKIGEMIHESIELKDWEIMVNGKNNFLDANKKIFDDVTDISIIIKNQGIQDGSSFESIITFNEIEIHLNNNSIILDVVDIIEFDKKTGLIKSIRAYKK